MFLIVAVSSARPASADPGGPGGNGNGRHGIKHAPVEAPRKPAKSPHRPSTTIQGKSVDPARRGQHAVDPIDLKVLVIAADGNESDFPAIKAFLDQIGVPYDVYQIIDPATGAKTPLDGSRLWDGGVHGYYQGVILTTDSLVYYDAAAGNFPSAFTPDEWNTLWTYESMFNIRQVTFNTTGFGPEQFGLVMPPWDDTQHRLGWQQTAAAPVNATLTTAGQQQLAYLNPAVTVSFTYADVVLARPDPAATTVTPLLTTADGYAMASTYKNPNDGRENLAITSDGAPWLAHSLLLSYSAINWVTKGLFLGERHVYLNPQPDDIGIDDDIWDTNALTDTTGITKRMTGSDFNAAIKWQNTLRTLPNASQITLEWPFNAEGFSGIYPNDTLTPAVKKNQSKFKWINHTWSHANFDQADAATVIDQLSRNDSWARSQGKFNRYSKDAMIQPDISGLYNPNYFQGAYTFGIRNVTSDTSRRSPQFPDDWNNPSPNAGFYRGSGLFNSQTPISPPPSLLIVPRHASNLFYNLYTPQQWVSEYNCYYSKAQMQPGSVCAASQWKYWDRDLTYSEILDKESDVILQYLLKWDLDPIMFHQPNMAQYASGKTLLGDLITAVVQKYNNLYNLPILSPGMHDQGVRMGRRMAYNLSGVQAQMVPCGTANATPSVALTTVQAARIPLTGIAYGSNREVYGGQNISYIDLPAGGSVTIPLTCP